MAKIIQIFASQSAGPEYFSGENTMSTANRIAPKRRLFGSNLAMAIALACGTTLGVVALDAPAHAQKKKKEKKQKLSKGFQKVYNEAVPLVNAEEPDEAAIRATVPGLLSAASSPYDNQTAGNLLLKIGGDLDDTALQIQGVDMMLNSGLETDRVGLLNYAKFQFHEELGQMDEARTALIAAADAGYIMTATMSDGSSRELDAGDLRVMASQTYFDNDQYAEGLADLRGWLEGRVAQGLPIEKRWIQRGFGTAFNEGLADEATNFSIMLAQFYPTTNAWSDAVATQTNYYEYDNPETLDLMRLAFRTGAMSAERLNAPGIDDTTRGRIKQSLNQYYLYFGEAAGFNRLPGETKMVLEKGVAEGIVDGSDVTFAEWIDGANRLYADDKAELPSLEAEGRAASTLRPVLSAADVLLSYGKSAAAEELYTKALGLPGVDADRVNTRLGIAQVDQNKFAEAKASFAKVTGKRSPIARLWSAYAEGQEAPVASAPAAAEPAA